MATSLAICMTPRSKRKTQRRIRVQCSLVAGALLSLLLGGCGSTQKTRDVTVSASKIAFWSPALAKRHIIPAEYTCAPKIWLPLRWGVLPEGTRELVLYFASYGPPKVLAHGGTDSVVSAAAGVVGLKPDVHALAVGGLPRGAVGLSEQHVPICPSRTSGQEFAFELFALSKVYRVTRTLLNSESSLELLREVGHNAQAVGGFTARYG